MIARIPIPLAARCPGLRFIEHFVILLLVFLSSPTGTIADEVPPTEQEIARAIDRGVRFLSANQLDDGAWNEPSQGNHRLGVTALAGLALMENGIAADAASILRARQVVVDLAQNSNQTYDLTLAILFLARQQKGRKGESDALIRELAGRSRPVVRAGSGITWSRCAPP